MAKRHGARCELASLSGRPRRSVRKRPGRVSAAARPSFLESLEPRLLLSATFLVTTADDAGSGSLRQAILNANATEGSDTIGFQIASGVQAIPLLTGLPAITDPVILDGTTQPGYAGTPLIWLDGSKTGGANGLTITADNSTVRGLAITGFPLSGILLQGSGEHVEDSYVGVDPSGTVGVGNGICGIEVHGIDAAPPASATIRGNVISGNFGNGVSFTANFASSEVSGNKIGTDASGSLPLSYYGDGILVRPNDPLRGGVTISGNVISGNGGNGVYLDGAVNAVVAGNKIGTAATGTSIVDGVPVFLGNGGNGIQIGGHAGSDRPARAGHDNTIGGTAGGNLISGNFGNGVEVVLGTANIIQGNYIGTNLAGTDAIGNFANGVQIDDSGNTVTNNVISGNYGDGVQVGYRHDGVLIGSDHNVLQGNVVGTQVDGLTALPNLADGIWIDGSGNLIGGVQTGQGNTIAFNVGNGVTVNTGTGNAIRGNSIYSNASLPVDSDPGNGEGEPVEDDGGGTPKPGIGIDLGYNGVTLNGTLSHVGPNNYQDFPVLTGATRGDSAVTVAGTLAAAASQSFTIEFFSNPAADPSGYGQGQTYVDSMVVTTDAMGSASFTCSLASVPADQDFLTATATDPAGNTSEFSLALDIVTQVGGTPAMTTTTLSSSLNPSLFGQEVTFTAFVTNLTTADIPTGSVRFTDGSTLLGTSLLDASGQATLSTPNLGLGDHTIVATFIPDGAFSASASDPLTQTVNPLPSSLGGQVYIDVNDNGQADLDEPGIGGVEVGLTGHDDLGHAVALTTQTNGAGAFLFSNLRPGTYSLVESQPAGYLQGKVTVGSLAGTASGDAIGSIVLEQGRDGVGYNFGELLAGSISGSVFLDSDDSNTFESDEAGIGGVTVTLTGHDDLGDSVNVVVQTDGNGLYAFPDLRPGVYAVAETQPQGYFDAAGAVSAYTGIGIHSGLALANDNFADILPSSLAGLVYLDANDNGLLDAGDSGIALVDVTLTGTDDLDNIINLPAQTDSDGAYSFANLRPGTYSLVENQPAGYLQGAVTAGNLGGTVGVDLVEAIAVAQDQDGEGYTFGEVLPGTISGRAFLDSNDNAAFDSGETGIGGVSVTLTGTDDLNNHFSIVAVTNSDGLYAFTDLRPGSYSIVESQPGGFLDAAGSANAYSGIAIASDVTVASRNFAEVQPGSLTGSVYLDANKDGIRQAAEAGISGVTVTLTGTNDLGQAITARTAQTATDGSYLFDGMRPGTYKISEAQPAGYQDGLDAVGSLGGTVGNDFIDAIGLASGKAGTGYNFAEQTVQALPGKLSGRGLQDTTGNGLSADDTAMGGITINLYLDRNNDGNLNDGAPVAVMVTPSDTGAYSFSGLAPGRYFVQEVAPCGYVQTAPALSTYYTVQVADGVSAGNLDFDNFLKPDTCRVTGVSYLINSTTTVSDLRGHTKEGDLVQVVFTITAGVPVQLSLVSYTAPDSTFVAGHASQQAIFDVDTGVFSPGTYTMAVTDPDSYYQVDFVVGPAIDHLGPANSNIFYSAQGRLISADNEGTDPLLAGGSGISGTVYNDVNINGRMDAGEVGLGNVSVTLTGTDNLSHAVRIVMLTDLDGQYKFSNLRPGTYTVTESQPVDFTNGDQTVGTAGGTVVTHPAAGTSGISGIVLGQGVQSTGDNFGELAMNLGPALLHGQAATILFWKSSLGQTLIKSFNGSSNSKTLGNWLATNFPQLYGSQAGTNNLAGKTNAQVATMFTTLYNLGGMRLDAQVMGLALSVYATNSALAGTAAQRYGFLVSTAGVGASTYNVGDSGAAFDVATNTTMRIMDILKETAGDAVNGVLYNSSPAMCMLANLVYAGINTIGGVN